MAGLSSLTQEAAAFQTQQSHCHICLQLLVLNFSAQAILGAQGPVNEEWK